MAGRIKIYGERSANTNYMGRLIELNLNGNQVQGIVPEPVLRLQSMLPEDELVKKCG